MLLKPAVLVSSVLYGTEVQQSGMRCGRRCGMRCGRSVERRCGRLFLSEVAAGAGGAYLRSLMMERKEWHLSVPRRIYLGWEDWVGLED